MPPAPAAMETGCVVIQPIWATVYGHNASLLLLIMQGTAPSGLQLEYSQFPFMTGRKELHGPQPVHPP